MDGTVVDINNMSLVNLFDEDLVKVGLIVTDVIAMGLVNLSGVDLVVVDQAAVHIMI